MSRRAAIAATLAVLAACCGVAQAAGGVGDPPSLDLPRCGRFLKPCTSPLILATGPGIRGPVEMIGFHSRLGFCLEVDASQPDGFTGTSVCGGTSKPPRDEPVAVVLYGGEVSQTGRSTEVVGTARADVAGIRVRYRRHGKVRRARAIFGAVDTDLAARVGEDRAFGVFDAVVRGCVRASRIRVVAYDSEGRALGKDRFPEVGDPCDPGPPPPMKPSPSTGARTRTLSAPG